MELFGFRFTRVRVGIISLLVFVAMAIPRVRFIIWWLLPLGSGWDDLIGGAALVILAVLVFVELWTKGYPNNPYNQKREKRPW